MGFSRTYDEYFNSTIQQFIFINNTFIYKNNLELLRKFYNSLIVDWFKFGLNNDDIENWLNNFRNVSKITPVNIELEYSKLILEKCVDNLYLYDFNKNEGYGLYFIYDTYGNIIYIGKSKNVETRALQSFINKYPYGATSIKIVKDKIMCIKDILDKFESVIIDYYKPLYNNTNEDLSIISHRLYANTTHRILKILDNSKQMFLTSKKEYCIDEETIIV